MSGTPARQVTLYSNAGHTLTHMHHPVRHGGLHLPGVFDLPYGECLIVEPGSRYVASRLYRLAGSVTVGVRLA